MFFDSLTFCCFIRNVFTDGHLFVAEQLKRSLICYGNNWPVDLTSRRFHQNLNAIIAHVNDADACSKASTQLQYERAIFGTKQDSEFNVAPLCTIYSSSPGAMNMNVLLTGTLSGRRSSRNAQFSYHFDHLQTWLDMTLTLPYPIMLREVIIKPHTANLSGKKPYFFFE